MSSYLSSGATGIYRMSRGSSSSSSKSAASSKERIVAKSRISSKDSLRVPAATSLGPSRTSSSARDKISASSSRRSTNPGISRRDSIEVAKGRRGSASSLSSLESSSSSRKNSSSQDLSDLLSHQSTAETEFSDDAFEEEQKAASDRLKQTSAQARPVSILSTAKPPSLRNTNGGKRRVSFNKSATLHYMPAHELAAARKARRGSWEPAPEHDELWDGDLQDFRRVPLTESQFNNAFAKRDTSSFQTMNYTYPPSSSDYGYDDMDELDAYMNDLSFDDHRAPSASSFLLPSSAGPSKRSCYICTPAIDWPSREVAGFIRDHIAGGDYFCSNFELNRVDGPMFLQMEERDLRNIGIKRRADRQSILMAKHELVRGSLAQQSCGCAKSSSLQVLDRHSRFLEHTQTFLNTL